MNEKQIKVMEFMASLDDKFNKSFQLWKKCSKCYEEIKNKWKDRNKTKENRKQIRQLFTEYRATSQELENS